MSWSLKYQNICKRNMYFPLVKKIKERLFGQPQEDANNTEREGSSPEERGRLRNGPWHLWTECDKHLEMKHIVF